VDIDPPLSMRMISVNAIPPCGIFTPMGERSSAQLDRVLSALSDPTRRAILARLAESAARVTDVADAFPISLNSTSKHIRALEAAGLVRRVVRGREHILSLDAAPLADVAAWTDQYRAFWSEQLASLDAFVTNRQS
jgi:DNA-binding transcriptional ArsR family regulator